ncbi:MAG: tetratricopeptide repeat protein [Bacteroidetes bacterium]|nr:tetratricopeptide repeat protein [Bacteroidota bacterium]
MPGRKSYPAILTVFLLMTAGLFRPLLSQDLSALDSLRHAYRLAAHDTVRLLLNAEIAHLLSVSAPDSAVLLGTAGADRSRELGFMKGEALNLNAVAAALFTQTRFPEAMELYAAAHRLAERTGDKALIATAYLNFGNIYFYQNDNLHALENFERCLALGTEIGDPYTIATASVNIGAIHVAQGRFSEGLRFTEQAAASFREMQNWKGVATSLRNIAIVYHMQREYDKALDYIGRSLRVAERIGNQEIISGCLHIYSDVYRLTGEYRKSISYGLRSLEIARSMHDMPYVKYAASTLATTYEEMGDYRNALKYAEIARTATDSIVSNDRTKELQRLQHRFEMEGKQKEIELLEQRSTNQQLVAVLFATGLGAVLIIAVVIHRNLRRQRALSERLAASNAEKEQLITELRDAMEHIRTLGELLPVCSNCKNVRDDQGYWQALDRYISAHTDTKISHGICPDCMQTLYPEIAARITKKRIEA